MTDRPVGSLDRFAAAELDSAAPLTVRQDMRGPVGIFHHRKDIDERPEACRVQLIGCIAEFTLGQRHRDHDTPLIGLDTGLDHLPVTRLEDVERQSHAGKHHESREREERQTRWGWSSQDYRSSRGSRGRAR